jgi:hypothetical protein
MGREVRKAGAVDEVIGAITTRRYIQKILTRHNGIAPPDD